MTMGSSKKSLKHLSKAEKKVLGRYAVWQLNGKKGKELCSVCSDNCHCNAHCESAH